MIKRAPHPRLVHRIGDLRRGHWMRRHTPLTESLRGYGEDRAVSVLTQSVIEAVQGSGQTRAEVAALLGTTKGYVSQVLNGSTNMTLKTLGAFMWAAGRQVTELRTGVMGAEEQPAFSISDYISGSNLNRVAYPQGIVSLPANSDTHIGVAVGMRGNGINALRLAS